jgi:transposase
MKRRNYTNEFKEAAVKLVTQEGYSQVEAARSLGIKPKLLNTWVKRQVVSPKPEQSKEQEELLRLRLENKRLKMERDILKKAAAFFAGELG